MNATGNIDFTEIQKKYPLHDTLIGCYAISDESFIFDNYEQVKNIENWKDPPLTCDGDYIPFIYFNGEEYECLLFWYDRVCGYYYDGKKYGLVTNNSEFGVEIVFPDNADENHIIIVPNEENLNERIGQMYDSKAYNEGKIFTTYDELKNFVRNREKNS